MTVPLQRQGGLKWNEGGREREDTEYYVCVYRGCFWPWRPGTERGKLAGNEGQPKEYIKTRGAQDFRSRESVAEQENWGQ